MSIEKPKPTTRNYAASLRMLADFLDSRPEFETQWAIENYTLSFYDKNLFVAAVRALGSVTKKYTDGEYALLLVTAKDFPLSLSISRDKVCTKKVVYDCEPLFSPEEVNEL